MYPELISINRSTGGGERDDAFTLKVAVVPTSTSTAPCGLRQLRTNGDIRISSRCQWPGIDLEIWQILWKLLPWRFQFAVYAADMPMGTILPNGTATDRMRVVQSGAADTLISDAFHDRGREAQFALSDTVYSWGEYEALTTDYPVPGGRFERVQPYYPSAAAA